MTRRRATFALPLEVERDYAKAFGAAPVPPQAHDEVAEPAASLGRLLLVSEVADLLAVSERTVSRYVEKGRLRALKLDRLVRFREADVLAFIQENIR
jgi:excisionase family DNA binding protein